MQVEGAKAGEERARSDAKDGKRTKARAGRAGQAKKQKKGRREKRSRARIRMGWMGQKALVGRGGTRRGGWVSCWY
jgi:hypothetical protein